MLPPSRHTPDVHHQQLKACLPCPSWLVRTAMLWTISPRCAQLFHAINLKHTRTGGLSEMHRMIHAAKAQGLAVRLRGFSETSLPVTILVHVAPLVDYTDLDAAPLLAKDPFTGVTFNLEGMTLPGTPGIGAMLNCPCWRVP